MPNALDKELEKRGHRFVRYADDSMIFCRTKRAAQRVLASTTKYIEEVLYLKVNREKTVVAHIKDVKFFWAMGFTNKERVQYPHPQQEPLEDESQDQGADIAEQRLGQRAKERGITPIHNRLAELLLPYGYEELAGTDRRVAQATAQVIDMETMECIKTKLRNLVKLAS